MLNGEVFVHLRRQVAGPVIIIAQLLVAEHGRELLSKLDVLRDDVRSLHVLVPRFIGDPRIYRLPLNVRIHDALPHFFVQGATDRRL